MTFYDSFARLGRSLDHSAAFSGMAWPWRHFTGLHYQSYSEKIAAGQAFAPMAWVWSNYRGSLIFEGMSEPKTLATAESVYEVSGVVHNEDHKKTEDDFHEVIYPDIQVVFRGEDEQCKNDTQISFIDILKLIAAVIFATSIMCGVHILHR